MEPGWEKATLSCYRYPNSEPLDSFNECFVKTKSTIYRVNRKTICSTWSIQIIIIIIMKGKRRFLIEVSAPFSDSNKKRDSFSSTLLRSLGQLQAPRPPSSYLSQILSNIGEKKPWFSSIRRWIFEDFPMISHGTYQNQGKPSPLCLPFLLDGSPSRLEPVGHQIHGKQGLP